jgi:hypothetical protein
MSNSGSSTQGTEHLTPAELAELRADPVGFRERQRHKLVTVQQPAGGTSSASDLSTAQRPDAIPSLGNSKRSASPSEDAAASIASNSDWSVGGYERPR